MEIEVIKTGPLAENCYIIYDESTLEGMVVDPGASGAKIVNRCEELKLNIIYVFFTHAHFDHISAYHRVKNAYTSSSLILGKNEEEVLFDRKKSMMFYSPNVKDEIIPDILVSENDVISFGSCSFKVIETPGHTVGSVCLYTDGILISGDTLFEGSYGRVDLPTGSLDDEINSISQKLFSLPDDTVVYSGHGAPTKIGIEKKSNEVLRWISD